VRGDEHEDPDLLLARGPRLAVEPRPEREQSEAGRAYEAGQAGHDCHPDNEFHDANRLPFQSLRTFGRAPGPGALRAGDA
jgi:hypothetical protein